ncbi:MAG TPA: hypothetical protein VKM55_08460 [Candidatus Lokiarchaeia archaeon]|nr:hypothetical protein [Candidatus Lokiarchaeia archaeon]
MSRDEEIKIQGMPPNEWEGRKEKAHRARHDRYEFIDQFRGLCVLFLTFAWVTIQLGWNKLVPAILSHGFVFYNDEITTTWNWLQVDNYSYTWIDLGASLFMIIVGVTVPISFRSRAKKDGTGMALLRLFLRYPIFIGLQLFLDAMMKAPMSYQTVLLGQGAEGFMTRLGIGTVVAGLAAWLVKHVDRRFLLAVGIMAVQGVLYIMPGLQVFHYNAVNKEPLAWMGNSKFFDYYMIPFDAISYSALAIAGTCFWDWLDKDNVTASFKRRILPVGIYSWVACFVVCWFIPFSWMDASVTQDLLALGMVFFMLTLFFCMEQFFKYKIPYLSALGKNALILYIIGFLGWWLYMYLGLFNFVTPETAWLGLVLCTGLVVPVVLLAWVLDKNKIYWRF